MRMLKTQIKNVKKDLKCQVFFNVKLTKSLKRKGQALYFSAEKVSNLKEQLSASRKDKVGIEEGIVVQEI